MRSVILIPILALAAGCAASPAQIARAEREQAVSQQKLAAELQGLTPGHPVSCLDGVPQTSVSAYGSTLLYRANRNLVYRTETNGGCEGVAHDDILVTVSPMGRVCQGDIARTISRASHFQSGACALGEFVPYRKAS